MITEGFGTNAMSESQRQELIRRLPRKSEISEKNLEILKSALSRSIELCQKLSMDVYTQHLSERITAAVKNFKTALDYLDKAEKSENTDTFLIITYENINSGAYQLIRDGYMALGEILYVDEEDIIQPDNFDDKEVYNEKVKNNSNLVIELQRLQEGVLKITES